MRLEVKAGNRMTALTGTSALVSAAPHPVINSSRCFTRNSQFFGPHLSWPPRVTLQQVNAFAKYSELRSYSVRGRWLALLGKRILYLILLESTIHPPPRELLVSRSPAIFWMTLHPVVGFHIIEASKCINMGQKHELLPKQLFGKFIQLEASSDMSCRGIWEHISDAKEMWIVWERRQLFSGCVKYGLIFEGWFSVCVNCKMP